MHVHIFLHLLLLLTFSGKDNQTVHKVICQNLMITEILSLCHQSPGTVLCWMPVHLSCAMKRFLAAGQGPALLSIQEPEIAKFHYSQGALCKWRHGCFEAGGLIAQFPPLARVPRDMGEAADKAFRNSSLIIALQFSQNKTQRQIS